MGGGGDAAHMDISRERVGGEDAGAGAIGEVERGDGVDGLSDGRGRRGGTRGRDLGSPLGCGGRLLLRGRLLAGVRNQGEQDAGG